MFRQVFTNQLISVARRIEQKRQADATRTASARQSVTPRSVIGYEIDELGTVRQDLPFRFSLNGRMSHTGIFAGTGAGKSVLIRRIALSTITDGCENTVLQDPRSSDLTEKMLAQLVSIAPPLQWVGKLGLIDLVAPKISAHNPLFVGPGEDADLIASAFSDAVIDQIDQVGVRWEELLRKTTSALCKSDYPACPMDIQVFLANANFRAMVLRSVRDPFIVGYFTATFDQLSSMEQTSWASAVNNKVGRITENRVLRRLFRSNETPFNFSQFFDDGVPKTLLISLRLGLVPRQAALLASKSLVAAMLRAAFAREAIPEENRRPTNLLVDEFSHIAADEQIERMLVETRKYAFGLTLSAQSFTQIPSFEKRRLFASNLNYLLAGRLGDGDATDLVREAGSENAEVIKQRLRRLSRGQMMVSERGKRPRFIQVIKDDEQPVDRGAVEALRQIAYETMGARSVVDIDREIEQRYTAILSGNSGPTTESIPAIEVRGAITNRSHRQRKGGNDG